MMFFSQFKWLNINQILHTKVHGTLNVSIVIFYDIYLEEKLKTIFIMDK